MRAEKVVSFLLNDAQPVTSIVGNNIFGGASRQNVAPPLIVYAKQGADRETFAHLDPADGQAVGSDVDVIVVAKRYPDLKDLAEAVRVALFNKGGTTIAGVVVLDTQVVDEGPDQYDPDQDEFAQVWTFKIVHVEP